MQFNRLKRRAFVTLIGGAAAWPLAARAQQPVPVIGFLGGGSPGPFAHLVAAFREGLRQMGYAEPNNVAIEYRWAEGQYDRLAGMANDLVRRRVAVILASGGTRPTLAAKAATATIPIVFLAAADPVAAGLVASLNRPGGNVTGFNFLVGELATKQLGLLRELMPTATSIVLLINPDTPAAAPIVSEVQESILPLGLRLRVLTATSEAEIDEIFAGFKQQPADPLIVQVEPFFTGRWEQVARLAIQHRVPTIAGLRAFAAAGGLMSYGSSIPDAYRLAGIYVGRILKGETPADLPVQQPTKFELVINLKTAKALGLAVPDTLLALADEVIE